MIDLSLRRSLVQPLSYTLLGIGGAGIQVLDRLIKGGMTPATLKAMDTDQRVLAECRAGGRILLGCGTTAGLGIGAGGDPEVGRAAFAENRGEVNRAIEGCDVVILLGGLGGGTGSGAVPEAAREAKEAGALVIALVTLPFSFEGKRRVAQAAEALSALEGVAELVLCFENDRMSAMVSPTAGISEAFVEADRTLAGCVEVLLDLLSGSGLIHLGFADLKAALPGVKARALFGHGVAEGSNRPFDALARALRSPLMDRGRMLADCETVLAQVSGGPEMTLHEVELLMEELNRHVGEGTQILFGASVSSRLAGWMGVTLLASTQKRAEVAAPFAVLESKAPASLAGLGMIDEDAQSEEGLEELAPRIEPEIKEPVAEVVAFVQEETPEPLEEREPELEAELEPDFSETDLASDLEEPEEELEAVPAQEIPSETPAPESVVTPEVAELSEEPEETEETEETEEIEQRPELPVASATPAAPTSTSPFSMPLRRTRAVRPEPGRELFATLDERSASAGRKAEATPAPENEELQVEPVAISTQTDADALEDEEGLNEEAIAEARVETVETLPPGAVDTVETEEEEPSLDPQGEPGVEEELLPTGAAGHKAPTQGTLKFEPIARGRFEKSEPTIVDGEDLDIPTYLRRNIRIR